MLRMLILVTSRFWRVEKFLAGRSQSPGIHLVCRDMPTDAGQSESTNSPAKRLCSELGYWPLFAQRQSSVMQNHIEQGFVNTDTSVVLNEAELAEPIHKETHS